MSAYLGPAGGLVPFRCPSAVGINTDRDMSYRTTLGGRVKVQRGPVTRRQWQVDIGSATPQELANLQALDEGGTPPFVWVESYAQVTNLFTPQQSTLDYSAWGGSGVVQGGAVSVDGMVSPRSVLHPSGGTFTIGRRGLGGDYPPVVPGIPVSASVMVRGSGSLRLFWTDWQGASIGSVSQSFNHSALARVSLADQTPPVGAATARFVVTGMRQAAMPCFTWTPDAPAWSMGRGCVRSVTEGLSEVVQMAVADSAYMRRSALAFTVREVG